MQQLVDGYKRQFKYVRLSLTEACNFRCSYCLPDGYKQSGKSVYLDPKEIGNLVRCLATMGVEKIRLTGGEPLIRRDISEIMETVHNIDGIKTIAMTTNGYRFDAVADDLKDCGLNHVNFSLDSLSQQGFERITGRTMFAQVMASIDKAIQLGIPTIKINCVLLKGLNDHEFMDFLTYVKTRPVTVRFIELMETGDNGDYFKAHHLSPAGLRQQLLNAGWSLQDRSATAGPASVLRHPDYQGGIGFIEPYGKGFCDSCNRLRISARGGLRLCLFGDGEFDLRPYLQSPEQLPKLQHKLMALLPVKLQHHFLADHKTGSTRHLASIGG